MNHNTTSESTAQFILRISDTPAGFALERTDTKTHVIDQLYLSTSFIVINKVFMDTIKMIDLKDFRLVLLRSGSSDTKAVFQPI